MAKIDFTLSEVKFGKIKAVQDDIRGIIAVNQDVLARVCSQANGREKIKAHAGTTNGKVLGVLLELRNDLNTFFESVGWGDE